MAKPLYLPGGVDFEERMEAHLKSCAVCNDFLEKVEVPSEDDIYRALQGDIHCFLYICLKRKSDMESLGFSQKSVLHVACELGHTGAARSLVNFGFSYLLNFTTQEGETVLHCAASHGHLGVIRYIVDEKGCTHLIPRRTVMGTTVLHKAVSSPHAMDLIRYFVEEKGYADLIPKVDHSGNTVLHNVAFDSLGAIHVVRYFLGDRGCDDLASRANDRGETILHLAARTNNLPPV
eukprot:Rmarinus@m.22542